MFVTGEPGIGKTSLVQEFSVQVEAMGGTLVGRGQCVEQYGSGEAYLPILEAAERLCRTDAGAELVNQLSRYAPSWLVQMHALIEEDEFDALQRRVQGVTRERMLREMAQALEVISQSRLLVLIIEDLHWSDYSTIDLLSALAQRQDDAQLFIIGTYRPADLIVSEHPLKRVKQELQTRSHCQELPLDPFDRETISTYLSQRFNVADTSPLDGLARAVLHTTDGNPLFVVNVVEDLIAQGAVGEAAGEWALRVGGRNVFRLACQTICARC